MSANETLDPITSLRRAVARVASNTGLRDRARIDAAMARVERALSDSIAAVRERDAEIARLNKAASAWREYAEHLEHCPWCADDGVAECDRGGREQHMSSSWERNI